MIAQEMQKIDGLLDQKIQQVQLLLQNKKNLDYSLINNDLVYLYNEMLTFSYSLKLWLLNSLSSVNEHSEELLKMVNDQFDRVLDLMKQHESLKFEKTFSIHCIQSYQQLNRAI